MKRTATGIAALLLALGIHDPLFAQSLPAVGQRVRVSLEAHPDLQSFFIGEVTSIADSSFSIFMDRGTVRDIRRSRVAALQVSRGHAPLLRRVAVGAAAGFSLGYVSGKLWVPDDSMRPLGEAVVTAVGAILGTVGGMYYTGPERWQTVSYRTPLPSAL